MRDHLRRGGIAAAVLLGSVSLAAAGGAQQTGGQTEMRPGAPAAEEPRAQTGQLNLTSEQRQQIMSAVADEPAQQAPEGFMPMIGANAPAGITLNQFPQDVTQQVPRLQGHQFAKLDDHRVLLIDENRQVVEIVDGSPGQPGVAPTQPGQN